MNIDVMPTLINQFRETFEGEVEGMCWITDGRADTAIFGTIAPLSAEQAYAEPTPGGKSIASHVEHLRFTLDVTNQRWKGEDPKPDWRASFNLPSERSAEAWTALQRELHRAYDGLLGSITQHRSTPVDKMQPIHVAGLAGTIAHNAYHLGAIRQIAKVVASRPS